MSRYIMTVEYSKDRTSKRFRVFDTEMNCYVGSYGGTRKDRLKCLYAVERLNEDRHSVASYVFWFAGLALFLYLFSHTL